MGTTLRGIKVMTDTPPYIATPDYRIFPSAHSNEQVVHWMPEVLLAAEVAFRSLHRGMAE